MRVALLDETDVFVGMVDLAEGGRLTSRHLPQVPECDLPPGRYKWNGKAFEPLPAAQVRPADDVPSLEEVVALLILRPNDPRLTRWAQWYRTTIEGRGKDL